MEFNRRTALKGLAASAAALTVPGLPRATAAPPRVVDVMSDTWVGHDGLGRPIPTHDEVGSPRADKFVAAFYFLWLGQHSTDGPYDIAKILAADPNAINETDNPAWGPLGHFHHWSEPYFGYYISDDRYVLRKHAHMLADAGVDVIVFDTTNNVTYPNVYHALLDTFAAARADGNATPQVAFLTPFGTPGEVVSSLYSDLYQPGVHEDLWFRWKGKPLILADPAGVGEQQLVGIGSDPAQLAAGHTQGQTFAADAPISAVGAQIPTWSTSDGGLTFALYADGPGGTLVAKQQFTNITDEQIVLLQLDQPAPAGTYYLEQSAASGTVGWWRDPGGSYADGAAYLDGAAIAGDRNLILKSADSADILDFFTFRKPQPSYFVGPTGPDQWGWLESYPQHVFYDDAGRPEQMTVGVAQNAVDGRLGSMTEPASQGRSFHDGAPPTDESHITEGLNVQEQWDRALAADPECIFVTGWNEWVAERFTSFAGVDAPVVFVDEFDPEHSRDIEPMAGGFGDSYYYQLVANIRRFKGARPLPRASGARPITIDGHFAEWARVGPEFRDNIGDTVHRNHPGWGTAGPYVDNSGRNDIVAAKVSHDDGHLYFYVRTKDALTPHADPQWMMLFLDVTGDPRVGWEGFTYVVNRRVTSARRTMLERSVGGWNWRTVSEIPYAAHGPELELAIPRKVLALPAGPLRIDFKWIDNMQSPGDIMDNLAHGDAAPSGRFRYRYSTT